MRLPADRSTEPSADRPTVFSEERPGAVRRLSGGLHALLILVLLAAAGCSGGGESGGHAHGEAGGHSGRPAGGHGPGGGGQGGWSGGGPPGGEAPAIPVEVTPVVRRAISDYLETNGTLEAEKEVDLVARISGPLVELATEEGRAVRRGQLLARIDDDAVRAQVEVARVDLEEARLAFQRGERSFRDELISVEDYEQARARFEAAKAQLQGNEVQLAYTEIRAPFDGLIVERYVKLAEFVATNARLFRISDFDPLLCPIQVPERELPRLSPGQSAGLRVEAWGQERFPAKVLRIRPVVDPATGTVEVTLEVRSGGKLRPGMFASVYLETDRRPDALVIPKAALVLESLTDTVYVAEGGAASRRDVSLGFEEGDFVEVVSGVEEGEPVVILGQSGLSDGTPIRVLGDGAAGAASPERGGREEASGREAARGEGSGGWGGQGRPPGGGPPPGFDPSNLGEEQLERIKERMRERGLSDEQIEERLKRMREGRGRAP